MNSRIKHTIAVHFAEYMPELASGADLSGDLSLEDDLGADSLDIVELVMAVEVETGIQVPDEWMPGTTHVRDLFISDICTHPSKGIGCKKTTCMTCEFVIAKREAA